MFDVKSKISIFMDQCLQQIMFNTNIIGGIVIVLIWYTGHLVAVLGKLIWGNDSKSENNTSGLNFIDSFKQWLHLQQMSE